MKGGPFGDIKKICERKSLKAEKNLHEKILVKSGTRTHVLPLDRHQKAVTSMPSSSRVVWHGLVLVQVSL